MLAALVVVFLLFGPYLADFLRDVPTLDNITAAGRNALWFLVAPGEAAWLLGSLFTLAAAAVLVREALRAWSPRGILRLFDHAFVLALAAGFLANLWLWTRRPQGYRIGQFGVEMQTAWLLLFGVLGHSLASPRSRLVHWCGGLCRIISPAVFIVAFQLIQLPTLPRPHDSLSTTAVPPPIRPAALTGSVPDRPVFLFIFDEWSYRRTYNDGDCRELMPNLAEFSRYATTYHNARSPGPMTWFSIPSLLRGTPDKAEIVDFKPGFLEDGVFTPATAYPSIFTRSGCENYRKIMIQWGFAVSLWAADELDVRRVYTFQSDRLPESMGIHLYNAAFSWTDPWTSFIYRKLRSRVEDIDYVLGMYNGIRHDAMQILRDQPDRTFAIIHCPFPHGPFLLDADCNYRGRSTKDDAEGYSNNLRYLDRVIGEIVGVLKSTGRYEQALLVFTSDHSWRWDPVEANRTPDLLRHVPLIIKWPGQREAVEVGDEFATYRLGEHIGKGLRGEMPGQAQAVARR